jgi:hypothetical protein
MSRLGELIYDDPNWIIAFLSKRKSHNEIHTYFSHFHSGTDKGCNKPVGFMWIALTLQQLSHFATYASISFFNLVHQNHNFKPRYILLLSGWIDNLERWASSRILVLSSWSFGTTRQSSNHITPCSSSLKWLLGSLFIFSLRWNMPLLILVPW